MADRGTAATPGPVAALIAAVDSNSVDRLAACLAPDVRISLPSLHLDVEGRSEALTSIQSVLHAFPDLRYKVRQRYLAPGSVTDEATLEGTQSGEFFGAPPSGERGAVPARVMIEHDDLFVQRLSIWPDLAALRRLSGAAVRQIDLTGAGSMVSALRATIPTGPASKLIVGTTRDAPPPPPANPADPAEPAVPAGGAGPSRGSGRRAASRAEAPRSPLPRRVRRRRAIAAGFVMLLTSGGLVTWVAQGALEKSARTAAAASRRPAQGTTPASVSTTPSASPSPKPSPSASRPPLRFNSQRNEFEISNQLLFDVGKATLSRGSSEVLDKVIAKVRAEKRVGVIVVRGFTDNTGGEALNLRLSQQRADAVRLALISKLRAAGLRNRVLAEGKGISNDYPNETAEGRQLNRRVTVAVPPPRRG